jgi:ribosomal protein S18 acetylase RimI-like enzyme
MSYNKITLCIVTLKSDKLLLSNLFNYIDFNTKVEMTQIEILECNFNDPKHCEGVTMLLNHYMASAMGGSLTSHSHEKGEQVIEGLRSHPSKVILLARLNTEFVGLIIGYINFATFSARPFINIHDVVVLENHQGTGIGKKLLQGIIERSKILNCSKITLEVREDNLSAKHLYKYFGFDESKPAMHFWSKYL